MTFTSQANFEQGDVFYAELIKSHADLSVDESQAFNARLILLMANQIGSQATLLECLRAAQKDKLC
ncbi:MAG: hypothetical protein RLZZ502_1270 [Pseudomonadota bacterium]|jgi:hypothetical protein